MARSAQVRGNLDADRVLFVEGVNDCHVSLHIYTVLAGREPDFRIEECGNDDGVLAKLNALSAASVAPFKTVAAVLDADPKEGRMGIEVRLAQLRGKLEKNYTIPPEIPAEGLRLEPKQGSKGPPIDVWFMPNNSADGMLEDLLLAALDEDRAKYVSEVVAKAKDDGVADFGPTQTSKAIVHTYVAWRDPDIPGLGLHIKAGAFPQLEQGCGKFQDWLERVFPINSV